MRINNKTVKKVFERNLKYMNDVFYKKQADYRINNWRFDGSSFNEEENSVKVKVDVYGFTIDAYKFLKTYTNIERLGIFSGVRFVYDIERKEVLGFSKLEGILDNCIYNYSEAICTLLDLDGEALEVKIDALGTEFFFNYEADNITIKELVDTMKYLNKEFKNAEYALGEYIEENLEELTNITITDQDYVSDEDDE